MSLVLLPFFVCDIMFQGIYFKIECVYVVLISIIKTICLICHFNKCELNIWMDILDGKNTKHLKLFSVKHKFLLTTCTRTLI